MNASFGSNFSNFARDFFSGSKFPGSLGVPRDLSLIDYVNLRSWSTQLYQENYYAKGLIDRLITNEIHTGLTLESVPDAKALGLKRDALTEWTVAVETWFKLWGNEKAFVDWAGNATLGQMQQMCRRTALLAGDCLVILRQHKRSKLPSIELIDGRNIVQPRDADSIRKAKNRGHKLEYGVELDSQKRHMAFHVLQEDQTTKRIEAFGPKTGRIIAFLVYGSRKRIGDTRGVPILASVIFALKELDRYKDSEQRAAAINALLAVMVTKEPNSGPGSRPLGGGAVRKDQVEVSQPDGSSKNLGLANMLPGVMFDELAPGENVTSFNAQRPNVNFAAFEQAILAGIAWSNEIPPEILVLGFHQSWAASRAATSEFKIYLDRIRFDFSSDMLLPIYREWAISAALIGQISAPEILTAWRSQDLLILAAWLGSDWLGVIKPSIDRDKEVKAYKGMLGLGSITLSRTSRELTGTKFESNVARLKTEVAMLMEAVAPLKDSGLLDSGADFPIVEPENDEDPEEQKESQPQPLGVISGGVK
jgi:lambda family phage portal protein